MFRLLVAAVAAVAMLMTGAAVFAQGVITNYYTPPMHASDTLFLPIDIHPAGQPPWAGWAGGRMQMHLAPTGEMDVLGLTPVASGPGTRMPPIGMGTPTGPMIPLPFGPLSSPQASVPKFFTAIHPAAQASGINVTPSVNLPLFDLTVHVKNSDPSGNGNTDATFQFWNIWHIRGGPGSTIVQLRPSDYLWVHSSIQDPQQLHTPGSFYQFPTNPATIHDPQGHWLHLFEPANFHLLGGPGSQFYATFLNTALLHIEHVPEPAGIMLLSAGMACTVVGAFMRRRRRKLAA